MVRGRVRCTWPRPKTTRRRPRRDRPRGERPHASPTDGGEIAPNASVRFDREIPVKRPEAYPPRCLNQDVEIDELQVPVVPLARDSLINPQMLTPVRFRIGAVQIGASAEELPNILARSSGTTRRSGAFRAAPWRSPAAMRSATYPHAAPDWRRGPGRCPVLSIPIWPYLSAADGRRNAPKASTMSVASNSLFRRQALSCDSTPA